MYIYLYIYNSKYYTNKETIRTTSWGGSAPPQGITTQDSWEILNTNWQILLSKNYRG